MKIIRKAQSLILLAAFLYQAHGMCMELWVIVQEKNFTRWINEYLYTRNALEIENGQPIEQKLCEKVDDIWVAGQWLRRIQWAQSLGLKIELQKQKREPLRIKHNRKRVVQELSVQEKCKQTVEQHKNDRKQWQQELRHQGRKVEGVRLGD